MEYLKNPFVIGLCTAIIVYGVLYYTYKRNPRKKKKTIPLWQPVLAGIIAWGASEHYFAKVSLLNIQIQQGGNVISEHINKHLSKSESINIYQEKPHSIKMPTNKAIKEYTNKLCEFSDFMY